MPDEPVEKVAFLKTASPPGLRIGNYLLSAKVLESGNRAWSQLFRSFGDC
jgi:hypothetical protein